MKEIKFRFWDLNSKKWAGNMGLYQDGQIGDFSECFHNDAGKNGEHYIAQQYTGQKDCKEKEIYEGDIVKIILNTSSFDYAGEEVMNLEVKYHPKAGFKAYWGNNDVNYASLVNSEVLGNIFENPELLHP